MRGGGGALDGRRCHCCWCCAVWRPARAPFPAAWAWGTPGFWLLALNLPNRPLPATAQDQQVIELVTSLLAQEKVTPEQAATILQQMLPPGTLNQLQAHLTSPRPSEEGRFRWGLCCCPRGRCPGGCA